MTVGYKYSKLILSILLLFSISPFALYGQAASALYRYPESSFMVHTSEGATIHFKTVFVHTIEDLQTGLMDVKHLTVGKTMTFLYDPPRPVSMWMKNTYIPLDIWWLDTNLTIQHIEYGTVPHSLDSLSFQKPARAVVEVNAGLTRLFNINKGSRIEFEKLEGGSF